MRLVALGFYMMWEVSKAANFTHGDIYMVGAVTAVDAGRSRCASAVIAAVIAIAGRPLLLGALIERFLVRPFNTEPNAIGWMLTTIAIGIMLESGATQTYGSLGRPCLRRLRKHSIRFGGAGIYLQELLCPSPRSS